MLPLLRFPRPRCAGLSVGLLLAAVCGLGCESTTKGESPETLDAAMTNAKQEPAEDQRTPELLTAGPRLISNQSPQPLVFYGRDLPDDTRARLDGIDTELPLVRIDRHRLGVVLDPTIIPIRPRRVAREIKVRLVQGTGASATPIRGEAVLTVINDTSYPTPWDIAIDPEATTAFVTNPTGDQVFVLGDRGVSIVNVGDRPLAIERWTADGRHYAVVLHEHDDSLWVLAMDDPEAPPRKIPVGTQSQGLAIDGSTAWVSNRLTDTVTPINLETGEAGKATVVGVNPRHIAPLPGGFAVGNLGSQDVSIVVDGRQRRAEPDKETTIVGGHTAAYQQHIMGGKAPRDLAYSRRHNLIFVASVGPNIGPNADKMEVSMNGGIGVIDVETSRLVRHVSILQGIPQGLAYHEASDVLYVADVATGHVLALSGAALARADATPKKAILARLAIDPPSGFLQLRPDSELGPDNGLAPPSLHSGPRSLRVSNDGRVVVVLNQFTGTISRIDASRARRRQLAVTATWHGPPMTGQVQRRAGEIVYYTDMGNSRMTCDGCHYQGHDDGILFTKGPQIHIYRSTSLRSIRESPPYFTPAKFPSLQFTADFVLSRNRHHKPKPSKKEISSLALYTATLTTPPNPYAADDGGLPEEITLPDGKKARPRRGLDLFFGKGECASCHPPPQFTTDQDKETRARFYDVGTSVTIPLRPAMQNMEEYDLPAPALVGIWDQFPLLHSGAGGTKLEGEQVRARHPFALRHVVEMGRASKKHGKMHELSNSEVDDLLAYLLTL